MNKANSRWWLTDGLSEADIPSGEEQHGGRGGSTVMRVGGGDTGRGIPGGGRGPDNQSRREAGTPGRDMAGR